jgi:autotransporter-associated beta strand protein
MKDNQVRLSLYFVAWKVIFTVALLIVCTPVQAATNGQRVASGLSRPVFVTAPPGDTSRLFIVEQWTGRIKILNRDSNTINAAPFLTVPGLSTGSEQGLLGLAFDPNYATNGRFYVDYTDSSGNTQVRRYERSGSDSNLANPASSLPILSIAQPQSNHNGGWLGFGPNGYLYIGSGDGGGDYDDDAGHDVSVGNGQSLNTMLGKMLRVDINNDAFPADPNKNYAIPASNPFAAGGGLPEIWAYGLRNPWRPSFDRATGNLWIADVGQATREEIDFQTASSPGGVNYGWRLREGLIQTPTAVGGPKPTGAVDPIFDYPHSGGGVSGISVTGGYVYRGPIAELQGQYFFSDYGNPKIWTLTYDGATLTGPVDFTPQLFPNAGAYNQIVSFGEDGEGNLYIVDLDGEVFKVGPEPVWSGASSANNLWTTAANWGSLHPAIGSRLKFGTLAPGGQIISHNDLTGTPQYNGLRFQPNAAAYTLEGNPIGLTGAAINESANDQIIALPLVLGAGGGSFDTGAKNLTVSSVISGAAELIKVGSGALKLKASNIYTGNTTISQGTLILDGGDLSDTSVINVANVAVFAVQSGTPVVGHIRGQGATVVTGSSTVLTALSIIQNSLSVGSAAAMFSQPTTGGPMALSDDLNSLPEPSNLILLGVGVIGFISYALRRRRGYDNHPSRAPFARRV